jgi:hypothetical protein
MSPQATIAARVDRIESALQRLPEEWAVERLRVEVPALVALLRTNCECEYIEGIDACGHCGRTSSALGVGAVFQLHGASFVADKIEAETGAPQWTFTIKARPA